jgi:hypothetical protein
MLRTTDRRRHIVSGLLAGAVIAASPALATAATTQTGSQSVTADVANTLEATFPSAYAWGPLDAGATGNTSAEQIVNVKSNAAWGVKVATDLADGKMKEWTGAAYVASSPKVLTNALTWRLSSLGGIGQATSFNALSSVQALVSGTQAATDDTGVNVGVRYHQVVSYADLSAGVTNDYRVLVSYDVAQGY